MTRTFNAGDSISIPDTTTYRAFEATLADGPNDTFEILDSNGIKRATIPKAQFAQCYDDLCGIITSNIRCENETIQAILNNPSAYVARGNDGIVFDPQDGNMVKASSHFFFHWAYGIKAPGIGNKNLERQVLKNEELRNLGVPGLLPQTLHYHEGRTYCIMPKVDTAQPLTFEHIRQVQSTLKALHDLKHVLGDQIQVGLDSENNARIFDTGSIRTFNPIASEADIDRASDNNHLQILALAHRHPSKHLYADPAFEYQDTLESAHRWEALSARTEGRFPKQGPYHETIEALFLQLLHSDNPDTQFATPYKIENDNPALSQPLFWNTTLGWVSLDHATTYFAPTNLPPDTTGLTLLNANHNPYVTISPTGMPALHSEAIAA